MGKSQNRKLLFCCCFMLLGLMTFVQARTPPYIMPRDCPANEFYTECGDSCQTECRTLGQPCLIRHIRCPDGCYCNKGYARDDTGKCIPISNCRR